MKTADKNNGQASETASENSKAYEANEKSNASAGKDNNHAQIQKNIGGSKGAGEKKKRAEPDKKAQEQKSIFPEQKNRKRLLQYYLLKCGYDKDPDDVKKDIRNIALFLAFTAATIYSFIVVVNGSSVIAALLILLFMFSTGFALIYLLGMLMVFVFLDLTMFRRKSEIEAVLADFLQLTSANMHAGMTLDKALWFAIRPRFGILAKEVEAVAKETASGTPLEDSLRKFADKYESQVLQSSVSLIIEGLSAGGEMGPLISRIAINIKENQLMMREMAANVSTYVIFIGAATLFVAPLLMALSYQLLIVITKLSQSLEMPTGETASAMPMAFSQIAITTPEFRLFSILSLSVTALFSALIISIIKSGDPRNGIKAVFGYILTAIALFLILSSALKGMFASFI
jgi:Flp pilus assembly protein TadB